MKLISMLIMFVVIALAGAPLAAVDTPTLPGADLLWKQGSLRNYQEVVTKVEANAVTITAPADDAAYQCCRKMIGQITGTQLKDYAVSKKATWKATGGLGLKAYYTCLQIAAKDETDTEKFNAVVALCRAGMGIQDEAASANSALFWLFLGAKQHEQALLHWQNYYSGNSLWVVVDQGLRAGTISQSRAYIVVRDYLLSYPPVLDGATACKLYGVMSRAATVTQVPTADFKPVVMALDKLYATRSTGNADWNTFRDTLIAQQDSFKRAAAQQ